MSRYGLAAVVLVLLGCREKAPQVLDRELGFSALGQFPDLERDLRAYGTGRAAEIEVLERSLGAAGVMPASSLDSIGAAAAELPLDRYTGLAGEVDLALVRWRETGKLDERLRRLDSLRVERKVLLVRLETRVSGRNQ